MSGKLDFQKCTAQRGLIKQTKRFLSTTADGIFGFKMRRHAQNRDNNIYNEKSSHTNSTNPNVFPICKFFYRLFVSTVKNKTSFFVLTKKWFLNFFFLYLTNKHWDNVCSYACVQKSALLSRSSRDVIDKTVAPVVLPLTTVFNFNNVSNNCQQVVFWNQIWITCQIKKDEMFLATLMIVTSNQTRSDWSRCANPFVSAANCPRIAISHFDIIFLSHHIYFESLTSSFYSLQFFFHFNQSMFALFFPPSSVSPKILKSDVRELIIATWINWRGNK